MRAPENANAARARGGAAGRRSGGSELNPNPSRRADQALIAAIDKSHSCQLRVSISTWRGQTKVELADFTAVVSGIYFQAGAGVSLDIEKLPELLKAIATAEREAIARGLL